MTNKEIENLLKEVYETGATEFFCQSDLEIGNLKDFEKWDEIKQGYINEMVNEFRNKIDESGSEANQWIKYDKNNKPTESGKYLVHEKDGKIHLEQWNNTGFAYNDDVITHFQKIIPPK